jgi:excisionase family DNA binding protein
MADSGLIGPLAVTNGLQDCKVRQRTRAAGAGAEVEAVRLLTIEQVARRWNLSAKTIRRLIWNGKLQSAPIGRAIRVPIKEIERFERALGA